MTMSNNSLFTFYLLFSSISAGTCFYFLFIDTKKEKLGTWLKITLLSAGIAGTSLSIAAAFAFFFK